MKVFRPTNNPITRGYVSGHPAYDFAGLNRPDEVRNAKDGVIIQRVDLYTTNWRNTGTLTTRDYGNFIVVRHTDGTHALYAHLRKGSSFVVGTDVKQGQIIARIGNTGNSTGPHLHAEYFNTNFQNIQVVFHTQQGGDSVANEYKGLDLNNPESMKVAVDIWHQVMRENLWIKKSEINNNYVSKDEYQKLEQKIRELENKPLSDTKSAEKLNKIKELIKNDPAIKINQIVNS